MPALPEHLAAEVLCARPGCERNFNEHIRVGHLMEWPESGGPGCIRCQNVDGTITESCYCREGDDHA
jgi:hypothetical protein